MLKIQEEFNQWKELSSSVNYGALRSLGDWKTRLMMSGILLEQSSFAAPVFIRITDVSEKIINDETFQSPPFYTHYSGYRVCLLVTLNGVDECKGSHISVTISILSGPYDAKLSWPLRGQFTVALLNQIKNSTGNFETFNVGFERTDMDSASPHSVTKYIYKRLFSHKELFSVSSTCKYLEDDTIYMHVKYLDKHIDQHS